MAIVNSNDIVAGDLPGNVAVLVGTIDMILP